MGRRRRQGAHVQGPAAALVWSLASRGRQDTGVGQRGPHGQVVGRRRRRGGPRSAATRTWSCRRVFTDGRTLLPAANDGTVRLWDSTAVHRGPGRGHGGRDVLAFAADSRTLAAACMTQASVLGRGDRRASCGVRVRPGCSRRSHRRRTWRRPGLDGRRTSGARRASRGPGCQLGGCRRYSPDGRLLAVRDGTADHRLGCGKSELPRECAQKVEKLTSRPDIAPKLNIYYRATARWRALKETAIGAGRPASATSASAAVSKDARSGWSHLLSIHPQLNICPSTILDCSTAAGVWRGIGRRAAAPIQDR